MKKFYESPVVELTGFSAEDVITTSTVLDPITVNEGNAKDFADALKTAGYTSGAVIGATPETSYNW